MVMRRVLAALICVLPLLAGCARPPGATPAGVPGGGVLPVPAAVPVVPTPLPTIGAVGDVVTAAEYTVTLHALQDPLADEAGSEVGTRLVALDLTVTALVDDLAYSPFCGTLLLADSTVATARTYGPEPSLTSGVLAAGESARGWLAFEVYADAEIAFFSYAIPSADGGVGTALFDLRAP
jgi:hypothetical protein